MKLAGKNFSLGTVISAAVAFVGVILSIVGVCVNWATYKVESAFGNASESFKLSELSEGEGYGAMAAFAYIAMVLAILCLAMLVAREFVNVVPKIAELALGGATAVVAIVHLIVSIVYCSSNEPIVGELVVSAGVILLFIGALLAAAAAVAHAMELIKK